MFGLEPHVLLLLIACLVAACAFEFVNGFHDTANAVATVIYTNSLRPWVAVVWSAFWNFVGVIAGGISVAMGIVYLLPVESLVDQNVYHGIAMVGALIVAAIIWNVGTWYYGLPSSSSHALIGSILGVGIAFSLLPGSNSSAVNWGKAGETGAALLISPLFGFSLTIMLMFLLRRFVRNKAIFKEPHKRKPPPIWIRLVLIATCTLVSYFHGSNDGQKGVGLIMLILIGIVPVHFALNSKLNPLDMRDSLTRVEQVMQKLNPAELGEADRKLLAEVRTQTATLDQIFAGKTDVKQLPEQARFEIRKAILLLYTRAKKLTASEKVPLSSADRKVYEDSIAQMRTFTDYAPWQVSLMVALSLGIGTMIGWQRIVKTIGERIGKEHLTYAQGASSELVAAAMIGASTGFGLPSSTTHVLSSAIAGSMVANRGIKNLNPQMVRNIALAWVLTLPVTMVLAGGLFLLFRSIMPS
ncbi:PiT family inorganic phosphate transporter [Hymenobacter luteus]|uniref:Phosphate transporter n=2 Tax=Hymenobacter TaxID=89966 RepID=A0A7W9T548_9BACT|nr:MULTISPECIES: inorganic phosphate transporter [Hymenobacter]MBB4603332.1 PiT family inorganic phosphate transporter [Hymenobacter latericoloratus]MBB6061110.1 PiT family inorganic phosphate transporter [Hymenobacter luteus]